MSTTPEDDDDRTQIIAPGAATPPPARATAAPAPTSFASSSAPPSTSSSAASSAGDSGNALPVGTFLGEFEINSVLGEGGFGIVYLAWDHSLERRVALKEYMPASLAARSGTTTVHVRSERHRGTFEAGMKSFINEAKLLAQFDHPSLVKVYRFWEANGTAYMVMPFYEGITLKDKLKQLGAPPEEAWLMQLLAPLTEALAVIHNERCYHRDIAPDNVILLQPNGRPLLLDFGAARRVIGDMTQALTVILKPGYAPVEQYAEAPHMKQGGWTDVYALAASIHFAIMGRTPPPSVSRLMGDVYVPLTQSAAGRYTERFLSAIDKALRVRPEDRTQTIAELRADLGLDAHAPQHAQKTQIVLRGDATGLDGDEKTRMEPPRASSAAPSPAPRAAAAAAASREAAAPAPSSSSSKTPLLIGVGALVLAGAGVAGYLAMGKKPAPPPETAQVAATTPAQAPAPAPVVAPPAAAPAAPVRFDTLSQFDAAVRAQTPGFEVTVTSPRTQLRVGRDKLTLGIKANRDGYLNVLVLDPDGALIRLFPNEQTGNLRVKGGQTLNLPQLETSDPVGAEHFLILVSEQPRDYAALRAERLDVFQKLPTGDAATALLANWNARTPMLVGTGASEVYGAARLSLEVVH